MQRDLEVAAPARRRIGPVEERAPLGVGIEDMVELDGAEIAYKAGNGGAHRGVNRMVRSVRLPLMTPPRSARTARKT